MVGERPATCRGRHRLGSSPSLCHCRDLPAVRERLAAHRSGHPRRRPPPRRAAPRVRRVPRSAVLMILLAGLTLVSAWFVATGAAAFASMIGR